MYLSVGSQLRLLTTFRMACRRPCQVSPIQLVQSFGTTPTKNTSSSSNGQTNGNTEESSIKIANREDNHLSDNTTGDVTLPEMDVSQLNPSILSLFKNPIVQKLWTAREEAKRVQTKSTGKSSGNTVSRAGKPPSASRVEVSYSFSTDKLLLETYRNPWGQMRFGKMMEDLDAMAGNIAFFHVHDPEKLIVTASVDRIRLRNAPSVEKDQHLSGQVTWTGTSSMEIRMLCHQGESNREWLEAFVTFVTLDPHTHKPVPIPPLIPQTAEERAHFEAGSARAVLRRKRRQQERAKWNDVEVATLSQSLMQKAASLIRMPALADPHSILMPQTVLQNAMIAQPQVRNLHNRIFGGYLMRVAFQLAFANAYLFGGARPEFMEVDHISFTKPVDVGDLLVFNSRILYTERIANGESSLVHLQVEAWVTEPEKVTSSIANQFYFTYRVPAKVREVLPSNIDEANLVAMRMLADKEQTGW